MWLVADQAQPGLYAFEAAFLSTGLVAGLAADVGLANPAPFLSAQLGAPLAADASDAQRLALAHAAAVTSLFQAGLRRGVALSGFTTTLTPWAQLLEALDPALLLAELIALVAVLGRLAQVGAIARTAQALHEDAASFCQANGLSLTEIAMLVTLSLGWVLFDVFAAFAEDDIVDSLSYGIFTFVAVTIVLLGLSFDVLCYFLVSGVGGGDVTLRGIGTDIVNNFLCLLRVVFCWLRYIFYDLQVEFVDFTFHYTDPASELAWGELPLGAGGAWTGAGLERGATSLWAAGWLLLWAAAGIFLDLAMIIAQVLAGFFKLAIAFFLLWLIVDLFLMRPFAASESDGLTWRRQR